MRRITTAIAMTSIVVAAAAGSAPAFATAPQAPTGTQGTQADGYLYAWQHPHAGGYMCKWDWHDTDWEDCSDGENLHNMQNNASDLWNNGKPGAYENVYFYYNERMGGAYACLSRGDSWPDLVNGGQTFNRGFWWSDGKGQKLENNIASHAWTNDDC
ncbi:MAG TPA: hypothetical protein VFG33_00975 [Kribbella sp.]|uniref:hypothetical protein n=1 Tax=Kribbella sp. TaxID=1871183 RepID=UPI002D7796E8|nr:hypothetical protein [Kribbella sp.]HET6291903.1 hypothetical protein [Kribbella sp.]